MQRAPVRDHVVPLLGPGSSINDEHAVYQLTWSLVSSITERTASICIACFIGGMTRLSHWRRVRINGWTEKRWLHFGCRCICFCRDWIDFNIHSCVSHPMALIRWAALSSLRAWALALALAWSKRYGQEDCSRHFDFYWGKLMVTVHSISLSS